MTLEELRQMLDNIQCNQRTVDVEIESKVYESRATFKVTSEIVRIVKLGGRVVIEIREARRDML